MVQSLRLRTIVVEEVSFPEVDYASLRRDYAPPAEIVLPTTPDALLPGGKDDGPRMPNPHRFAKLQRYTDRADRIQRIMQWTFLAVGAATMAPAVMRFFH